MFFPCDVVVCLLLYLDKTFDSERLTMRPDRALFSHEYRFVEVEFVVFTRSDKDVVKTIAEISVSPFWFSVEVLPTYRACIILEHCLAI
jgi:hypothetical protein